MVSPMRKRLFFVGSVSLTLCAPWQAFACAPPPPVFDEQKKFDTSAAIGKLLEVAGLNAAVKFESEKKSVFRDLPNADQVVVALTLVYNFCKSLEDSKGLTGEQKITMLSTFQLTVLTQVVGPRPVSTTASSPREIRTPPPEEQLGIQKRSRWNRAGGYQLALFDNESNLFYITDKKPSWADIYLNPLPVWITEGNKYFVIVGSVGDEAAGKKQMSQLKAKNPEYDFELYAPYGSNKYYGIMMASWASKQRANEALAVAKRIERTSFIWSCRDTGDTC
jgi:hypothetical protein